MTHSKTWSICSMVILGFGIFFAVACVTLSVIAMAMNKWIYYSIDHAVVPYDSNNMYTYDRWRGMFLECVLDNTQATSLATANAGQVYYNTCYRLGFTSSTDSGWAAVKLRNGFIATFSAGLFCAFVGLILAIVALILRPIHKHEPSRIICYISGTIFVIGTILFGSALVLFHITLDMEKILTGATDLTRIWSQWSTAAQGATTIYYTASYYIAIAGSCCCAVSAILVYLATACYPHHSTISNITTQGGLANPGYQSPHIYEMKESVYGVPNVVPTYPLVEKPRSSIYPIKEVPVDGSESDYYRSPEKVSAGKNVYRIY